MTRSLLRRSALLTLLALTVFSFACSKRIPPPPPPVVATPPPPPPPPAPPAPGITLSADRMTITVGQSVTLTWQSTNATTVTINPGVGSVPATGNRQVSPTTSTTYRAAATGPGGNAESAALLVTVNPAPTPPPVVRAPDPPRDVRPTRSIDDIFRETMGPVLFDYDKSNIRPSEEGKLLAMAAWLKQNAAVRFTIEGHADERGGQEYNIALGDDRAAAVKKYLAGQGVADGRMDTISYGEERPLCRAQTEECWQSNRRAAFVKIP